MRHAGTMLNRAELAMFLRSRRDRLRPSDVGLPGGARRRTAGLRRQEVAELAGMSVDYYVRLEQGRGPRPSRQVLSALARALMLTFDEREYLFRLVGEEDRNIIRWTFRQPETDLHWSDDDMVRFTRGTVADLRAAYARYPGDKGIQDLVTELLGTSPRFAEMWAAHEVEVRRRMVKRVDHPLVGPLEFECQVLHVQDSDQRLIVYCAAPGSPTQEAFRRLARRQAQPTATTPVSVPT